MKVRVWMLAGVLVGAVALAQQSQTPDPAGLSAAHSSLFEAPESEKVAARTDRLLAGLRPEDSRPVTRRNVIDERIFGKMERDGVPHAPLSTDREFLRRVRLDLTGRLPSSEEVRAFLADDAPDKREKLIDRLVGSDEWVDKWSYVLMDVMRVNDDMSAFQLFHYTLNQSLAADRPYDDFVRSMISASAKSTDVVAAANPIAREHVEGKPGQASDGDDVTKVQQIDTQDEFTIQFGKVFLGVNLSCISCHDGAGHLEKVNAYLTGKTREDFYRQAAFLGRMRLVPHVERTEAMMGHFIVDDLGPGYDTEAPTLLRVPRLGGEGSPKFILTDEQPDPDAEPREALARMLTADPQFARATVNMFWAKLMGFGFVDPYDEFDLARLDPDNLPEGWDAQPSHPELLEELAQAFVDSDYSLQSLFKTICNSSAYQLSSRFPGEWSDAYTTYYARKYARMLTAEELHDAITDVTGRPGELKDGDRTVARALQVTVPGPKGELKSFMQAFGQSNRKTVARPPAASPLQPIMMMRSPVVAERVLAQDDSRVQRLLEKHEENGPVIDELFVAAIARQPTPAEKDRALTELHEDRVLGAENLQWALLNLSEFLYNF